MIITKCDRCGAVMEPFKDKESVDLNKDDWRYSIVRDNFPYPESKIDLCLKCSSELAEWVKGQKK